MNGGVQSLDRAIDLLELIAGTGTPQPLSALATASGLPTPTTHRLLRALVRRGYARQDGSRRYTLGARLIHLGDVAGKLLAGWAEQRLAELRDLTGETANLALLDGDEVVYVAQAPSRHQMRMFTEPGRRFPPHCTAVGKALLAELPDEHARAMIARTGLPPRTANTVTDAAGLFRQLEAIRRRGYAVDDGEQEVGVRCLAVAIPNGPLRTAISVSGPAARLTSRQARACVPALRCAAAQLGETLNGKEDP